MAAGHERKVQGKKQKSIQNCSLSYTKIPSRDLRHAEFERELTHVHYRST